jgi:hypothetical protein
MSQMETLISTLVQNGLASSRSEAQRMAESMISTSDKVNQGMCFVILNLPAFGRQVSGSNMN